MKMFCSRTGHITEIIEVEVDRESESSVWIRGRVCRKATDYESYHATFQDAKDHLVADAQKHLNRAEQSLAFAQQSLAKVQALKAPTIPQQQAVATPTTDTSTELGFYQ